jgi:alpha-beta hydrolase superfamily lysophospholipase
MVPTELNKLDKWLAHGETGHQLVEGAEKCIVWAEANSKAQTEYCIVYLHGFSACRQESAPVADLIADGIDANLFYARLHGHGLEENGLVDSVAEDWKADALEALAIGKRLGRKVIIIAKSTGATLASWLMQQQDEDTQAIAALVFLSPNFAPNSRAAYLLDMVGDIGLKLVETFAGKTYSWEPPTELQAKYWTYSYPYTALAQMIRLVKEVMTIDKSQITVPTLMVYSPKDVVVSPSAIEENFAQWGSEVKELCPFELSESPNQHVLAGDIVSPSSTEALCAIISRFLNDVTTITTHDDSECFDALGAGPDHAGAGQSPDAQTL